MFIRPYLRGIFTEQRYEHPYEVFFAGQCCEHPYEAFFLFLCCEHPYGCINCYQKAQAPDRRIYVDRR